MQRLIFSTYCRQRSLAELTELIHTAFLIHRGLVDIETLLRNENKNSRSELELGNKMAVLSGDYLLANACVALSDLKNSCVSSMFIDQDLLLLTHVVECPWQMWSLDKYYFASRWTWTWKFHKRDLFWGCHVHSMQSFERTLTTLLCSNLYVSNKWNEVIRLCFRRL